ncbi:MAG: hypothetical protein GVY36_00090 [Verrucomicrobia bacterium]|nr:hypothetical protein [Verrucomicrobiota bacterium]
MSPVRRFCLFCLIVSGALAPAYATSETLSSDPIARLTSRSAETDFPVRHALLHAMDETALQAGASRLMEFLNQDTPPPEMEPNDFLSLKNDVADRLIIHAIHPSEHLRLALRTIRDRDRDFVWRDYCLQKIPELMAADALEAADRQPAAELLETLIAGNDPGLTGTALIAALHLSEGAMAEWAPPARHLGAAALDCARTEGAPLIDRVTALQVAAGLGHSGTATYAASLLHSKQSESSPAVPAMLRTSAIAALGVVGDPRYLALVEQHRRSPDVRLRAAARTAFDRLATD